MVDAMIFRIAVDGIAIAFFIYLGFVHRILLSLHGTLGSMLRGLMLMPRWRSDSRQPQRHRHHARGRAG